MLTQEIKTKKTLLILSDTSRSVKSLYDVDKFKYWLNEAMTIIEDFLFNSSGGGLSLKKYQVKNIEISMTICGVKKIKSLNSFFRGKSTKTDVLSFPIFDTMRFESADWVRPGQIVNLGDIFICKDVALEQSKEFQVSLEEELLHLFIHGLLHLCGFDHEISEEEEVLMFGLEEKLIKQISTKLKK